MSSRDTFLEESADLSLDLSSLTGLLLSDLERYFFYNGQAGRRPRKRDLWRNFLIPRCAPVGLYRVARRLYMGGFSKLSKLVTWMNFFLYGVEISARCDIGGYFFMPHASGTVIGATAIGRYAVIYHQVTLGAKVVMFSDEGRPVVGNNVVIGSGAKVLGNISIGNGCQIGANSVVVKSLPDNALAIGIPAQVTQK